MNAVRTTLFLALLTSRLAAADFFESKVRPLLIKHCYECHSESAGKRKGNLLLDRRSGWQAGGDSGPAIVPSRPEESLLLKAVSYEDPDLQMPPDYQLKETEIGVLEQWIRMGAPDPRTGDVADKSATIDIESGKKHWAFQPISNPAAPSVRNTDWARNDIDRFILAQLEAKQLRPADPASRYALLRRLFIDLTGLPPTVDQIREFVSGHIAYSDLVDELLVHRAFGERWAQHWLDLARYADSSGGGASKLFPNAWQYRNYVIDSYTADKPFNQFIREQIAGDLLPHGNIKQRREQLIATGFLVLGPRNYINDDPAAFEMDGVDEQLDTIGRAFLGLTIGCARCHDHKFDPIPTRDYYALAGFLTSTESADLLPGSKNYTWNVIGDPLVDPDGSRLRNYEARDLIFKDERKRLSKLKSSGAADPDEIKALTATVAKLRTQVPKRPAVLMGVTEFDIPSDCRLRVRGDPRNLGQPIPRGFLQVLDHVQYQPTSRSGRLQLARWIASPNNPLTARVYVNRVWQHLFGSGLVRTPDNFGLKGEAPSHAKLLDALAHRFMNDGWSTRRLIKWIVHSQTYQLGESGTNPGLLEADPENRLFGRRQRRSLDAEALRDSILAISEALDASPGDLPFPAKLRSEFQPQGASFRRSIYLPKFRNNLHEFLTHFDAANPAAATGRRNSTILPTQALFLMNGRVLNHESTGVAKKLLRISPVEERTKTAYLQTLGRPPTAEERRITRQFLGNRPEDLDRWADLQASLFSSVDFRFVR